MAPSVINGETIYWTNSIKPLTLMRDVYYLGYNGPGSGYADRDVMEFLDYTVADPNAVTPGGYQGFDAFRSELNSAGQEAYISAATIGQFSNAVNNIILDDARATAVGPWTAVRTINATTGGVQFYGD